MINTINYIPKHQINLQFYLTYYQNLNLCSFVPSQSTLMEKTPPELSVIAPWQVTGSMRIAWNVLEHTDSNPGTASALVTCATPPLALKCPWLSCLSLQLSDLLWSDLCKPYKLSFIYLKFGYIENTFWIKLLIS